MRVNAISAVTEVKGFPLQPNSQAKYQMTFDSIAHVPRVSSIHTVTLAVQPPLVCWEGSDVQLE